MGAPNQTQIHNWTDRIAALLAKDLAGFDAELTGAASASLWAQVDTSGDPAVETALGAVSAAIDDHSLPANYSTALGSIFGRAAYRNWVSALSALVTSAAGGGSASLRAYLDGISAQVHPLFAELARSVLSETVFTNGGDVTAVFAPNYQSRAPDRVYTGANGALVDDTADATSAGTADVALFGTNGHSVYIGSRYPFSQVVFGLSTLANTSIYASAVVSYWNGNAWVAVSGLTDNSAGLTKNDTIKWTLPTDWVRSYQDSGSNNLADLTPLYYVKLTRTVATLATPPVASAIRIIPSAVLRTAGGTSHLGVDQPPLALVRVTGVNTVVVEQLVSVDYARFAEPGIRFRALTPFGANLTLTPAYTNQAGTAGRTQAQSAWTAPAALDTVAVVLQSPDTGVRSVNTTGWAATTTNTQGVLEVYAAALRTPAL